MQDMVEGKNDGGPLVFRFGMKVFSQQDGQYTFKSHSMTLLLCDPRFLDHEYT